MKKRILSFGVMAALVLSLCGGAAFAAVEASTTISLYTASASRGSNGELKIFYDVQACGIASKVGISSIVIYKGDGAYVTTITGTTGNGLIIPDATRHRSTYIYEGDADTTYYAVVTGFATIGSDFDSKVRITAVV